MIMKPPDGCPKCNERIFGRESFKTVNAKGEVTESSFVYHCYFCGHHWEVRKEVPDMRVESRQRVGIEQGRNAREPAPQPTNLEWVAGPKNRIVLRPISVPANGRPAPHLVVKHNDSSLNFRLTAKRARDMARWLERYAQWAESQRTQGGR